MYSGENETNTGPMHQIVIPRSIPGSSYVLAHTRITVGFCIPCLGVETAVGDPSEEIQRMEAVAKQRQERAEDAELRAEERGHVSERL